MSNCFHYVITIALSFLTDRLIYSEYLCVFDLNHSGVNLWRMYAVKHSQQWAFTSESTILHTCSNRAFWWGELNTGQKNSLLLLNYDVFWCKNLDNIISGPQRTVQNNKKRQFMNPLKSPPVMMWITQKDNTSRFKCIWSIHTSDKYPFLQKARQEEECNVLLYLLSYPQT